MTIWVPYRVRNDPDFDSTSHKRLEDFILSKPSLERYHASIRDRRNDREVTEE